MNPMNNPMNPMKGMFQVPGMEELNRQNAAMIERTMKMFTPFGMGGGLAGGSGEKPASKASNNSEREAPSSSKEQKIEELKQNIAEMQRELNRMAAE
jgi:polyhydroxyalkanoate synthesis regulator protein